MSHELRLSDIGEGLEEAEIIEWKVAVGDRVTRDQPVVEIMTDKSNAELPAPVDGVVTELGGSVGDIVAVGAVLAVIAEAPGGSGHDEAAPLPAAPETATTFRSATADTVPDHAPTDPPRSRPASAASSDRPKAAPSTRAEAARRGIDLRTIVGSGPGGRILLGDLDAGGPPPVAPHGDGVVDASQPASATTSAAAPASPAPAVSSTPPAPAQVAAPAPQPVREGDSDEAATTEPLRGIRRVIATNMAQSWSTIPHIHATELVDAEPTDAFRKQLKSSGRAAFDALTPVSFFVAAVASALTAHPEANASLDFEAGTITHHATINVGIAVAAPNGLVVPVLRDAAGRSLSEIATEVHRLVHGAREGTLAADEYRGGTTTITNFGSLGGEQAFPLIRPGESTIFGFGSIQPRPFVIDDQVVARRTMHLVVAADHRLLDGDVTTAMLRRVAELLASPINLVLD